MKKCIFTLTGFLLTLLLALGTGWTQQQPEQEPEEEKKKEEPAQPFGFGLGQQPEPQPAAQPTPEEQQAVQQMLNEQNPQKRLELALEFLELYPESVFRGRAYATAAEVYMMRHDYAEAIEYGERALELSPRDAFTMIVIANALVESALPTQENYRERLVRAQDYATRALEILPELFASMQRRPEVPEEEYQKQERLIEAQAHAVLGFVYLRQRAYEQAEEELKLAIELSGTRPNATDFLRLGFAHVRQREWEEARDVFQQCVDAAEDRARNCEQQLERMENLLERKKAAAKTGASQE